MHIDPARWVNEYGDCLHCYALSRTRNKEVAEDLVQETLLAAVRTHEVFRGRSAERSWLMSILKNKTCDYFRRLGRETNFTDLELLSDEHADRIDGGNHWIDERGATDWRPEGEEAMKRAEFWAILQAGLAKMPKRVAQVFMLRELDDLPSKEVCATLQISEANCWAMLHRARLALRDYLEVNFFDGERSANF